MALDVTQLTNSMVAALPQALEAAQITANNLIANVNAFVPAELKKLATQLVAIEQGGFSPALAKSMLESQLIAFKAVLTGVVELAIHAAQELINALLKIVAGVVNGALNFALL
jgi:hypothetical protein